MAIKIVEFGVNTGAWSLENAKFGYVLASKEFKRGIHIRTLGNKNIDKIPFEIKEDIIHPTNEDLVGEIRVVSFNTPGNGMVLAQDSATMNLRVTIGALDTGVEEDLIVVIMKPGIKLVRYDSNADICSTFKYMRDNNL
ncbi:MAG TPA: hypothetical protein DCW90_23135, partial [Lachnospiraceae bacterium]|nr:hypothetical protein [Lachnospiraceae bacterium]